MVKKTEYLSSSLQLSTYSAECPWENDLISPSLSSHLCRIGTIIIESTCQIVGEYLGEVIITTLRIKYLKLTTLDDMVWRRCLVGETRQVFPRTGKQNKSVLK